MLRPLPLSLLALMLSAAPGQQPDWQQVGARLEAFAAREGADKGLHGLAWALLAGDRIVAAGGSGQMRPGGAPMGPDTLCRVGSVSKLFTDLAVLQLVEAGRVALDEPVSRHLPEFRPGGNAAPITLRQLMTHHAGLPREPRRGHYFEPAPPDLAATVASLNEQELVYAPGERIKYSNAGLAVVGLVLQAVDGVPFAAAIDRRILTPLGLRDTSFRPGAQLRTRLAQGYMWTYDGREFAAPTFDLGMEPAANLYATPADLVRFARVLFLRGEHPRVVSDDTLRQMFTPQLTHTGRSGGIGLGAFVGRLDGALRVGHGGAMYGFATDFAVLPEEELAIAVVLTHDFTNDVAERIADHGLRLARAALGADRLPEPPEPAVALGAPLARMLAGVYGEGEERLRLVEHGGELVAEPREGFRVQLRLRAGEIVGEGRAVLGGTLEPRPDGILWNGRFLARVPDRAPDPAPEAWSARIGEYGWDHDVLYVLERDGELAILIEWFAQYPLLPDGDAFRLSDRGLYRGERVRFVQESGDAVTAIEIGGVLYPRRPLARDGQTFRIQPQHDLPALRRMAAEARAPRERGKRPSELVELTAIEPGIRLDLRYATANNFLGFAVYERPRALMQRPAAEALARAHRALASHGFGLLVHDAYRPWSVTKMFWDATPPALRTFVADPVQGSRHNRGCAVDVTLCDLTSGEPAAMVAGYDEFTPRAYAYYPGGTSRQRWLRRLLRETLANEGFAVLPEEWWHFDHRLWREYPVLDEKL